MITIQVEREYEVTCDECHSQIFWRDDSKKAFIAGVRTAGWKLGKRDVCPDCQKEDSTHAE